MALCRQCGEDNPGRARFCLACGTPLAAAPPPPPPVEERKLVTALFTDIVGSTARAENLDPEDVREILSPYYARLRGELERHGGTVEKFIGDAVVALFGAPVAHEDDPERAVRAALAIQAALAQMNEESPWLDLHVRTGVNTGEALVVVGARASEGEGIASGDVMNTAARVQSRAPVDGILVGEATYRATAHAIEFREAEPIQAKGKTEPVPVWEVVGLRDDVAPAASTRSGLVGRTAELELLLGLWERVERERRPIHATVLGPPGIGKSRLVAEVRSRVGERGTVLSGRCLSYGQGITYGPVTEILKSAAGLRRDDEPAILAAKLDAFLGGLATDDTDELRTVAAAAANLVGVPTTPQGTYSADEISQNELHWGIRRLLQLLAETQPLLLVFEDLHWAESTLLELLSYLLEDRGAPMLILGSARPELADSHPSFLSDSENRRSLALAALTDAEGEELLGELLRAEGQREERPLRELLRHAGGNPLFLGEMIRMLADSGALAAGAEIGALPAPESLNALISSRLDLLARHEKATAQHAAVVGHFFWPGAVDSLSDLGGDAQSALGVLERRDFVDPCEPSSVAGELEYTFRHGLIREVAYGQLPKRRRVDLHVRCADWIERLPGAVENLIEMIAYHLEQACRLAREVARSPTPPPVARAVAALTRAAEKAERREGINEADRFYARALELVDEEEHETALDLRLRRCRTLVALGELREAGEQLLAVEADTAALGLVDLRCAALVALANVDRKQGRALEARRRLDEATALAAGSADRVLRIRATYELAGLRAWSEAAVDAALEQLRGGLALAEELDHRSLRIEGHMRMGGLLFNVGGLAEAEEHLARATALASEVGSFRDEARATSMLGFVRYYRGAVEDSERLALQALDWLERTCDSYLQLQNLRALAKYALAKGDAALAEERLRVALPPALEAGGWLVFELYRYLTEALVRQERSEEARELVEFAGRHVPEEDAYARAAYRLAEASVATAQGDQERASACFEDALRLLEEQSLLTDLGEARIGYARALRRFGDREGAERQLWRARETFAAMEAQALLAEIDGELAGLAREAGVLRPLALPEVSGGA